MAAPALTAQLRRTHLASVPHAVREHEDLHGGSADVCGERQTDFTNERSDGRAHMPVCSPDVPVHQHRFCARNGRAAPPGAAPFAALCERCAWHPRHRAGAVAALYPTRVQADLGCTVAGANASAKAAAKAAALNAAAVTETLAQPVPRPRLHDPLGKPVDM
ncbi:hypothetical protein FGB62_209g011 [Gracilaria domingensis]|nr:hypothetical protein FGB62_209g011 [Gracilaria domingensis]